MRVLLGGILFMCVFRVWSVGGSGKSTRGERKEKKGERERETKTRRTQ